MKPIYKNGEVVDFSDEGENARKIEDNVDLYYILRKLPPIPNKIAYLMLEGYTYKEIGVKLSKSENAVKQTVKRYKRHFSSLGVV